MEHDKFGDFLNRWITPVTLTAIFGAIVWGVQLNIAIVNGLETISRLDEQAREEKLMVARTVLIVDNMERRMKGLENLVEEHNKESEQWKRRIILNEQYKQRSDKRSMNKLERFKLWMKDSTNRAAFFVIIIVSLVVVTTYCSKAEAGGKRITNITNNTYIDKSSDAMGVCALGAAQAQINPTINSRHQQWGIGVGHCEGNSQGDAIALGYAQDVSEGPKHRSMINFSIGRSSDEVTSIGAGFNWHY